MFKGFRGLLGVSILVVGVLFVVSNITPPIEAAINPQINFQGKLTNPDGTNLATASYNFSFSIYSVSSGGSAIWTEAKSITVTDGIFQTLLGDTTSLPGSVDFNSTDLYLGVTVGADTEMTPRIRLSAAPYAFNSDRLGGLTSSNYLQLAQGLQADSSTTNASIAVNKTGTTARILDLQRGAATVMAVNNNGSVLLKNQADSTTGFQIQNASGTPDILFTADTTNNRIKIGNDTAAASANSTLFIVDNAATVNAPSGANGGIYYDSTLNKFQCYENGSYKNCVATLKNAYDNGTTGVIDLTDAKNFTINSVDTATDSNILVNLQCATCSASGGRFGVQDNGTDVLTVNPNGSIALTPTAAQAVAVSLAAGSQLDISATAAPTTNLVDISNAGQAATTANANGLRIDYVGGAANVEAAGARVDLTPGTTSGGIWNGLRIVANATGAVTGVSEYGVKLDGPTTPGAGVEVGIKIDAKWDAGLQLESKSAEPPTPPASNIYVFASQYAGRSILSQKGGSGVSFAYQPALFQNAITFNGPNTGTTTTSFGTSYTVDTTASHPAASETYGYATNFATAATGNDTAGISQTNTQMFRGSVSGGANGFFVVTRAGFPDANYGAGATGARFWTGLTNQTAVNATSGDNPAGHYAGFMYSTNRPDTNFQFMTEDNVTQNIINTGMAFTVGKVYDFYIYTPPTGTTVYWRIDNLTDGTSQEGSTTNNLPGTTTSMRSVTSIRTLTTTARNIRVAKTYTEADR